MQFESIELSYDDEATGLSITVFRFIEGGKVLVFMSFRVTQILSCMSYSGWQCFSVYCLYAKDVC